MKKRTLVTEILERVARKMGIEVHVEPRWGYVGQIVLPDGRKRYFRNTSLDINGLGSTEIARDKDYAQYFLKRMGYPVIPGETFYVDQWCRAIGSRRGSQAAYRYAKRIGFPVMVKPNSKSQGAGIRKAYTKQELFRAIRAIEKNEKVYLVQRFMTGHDYRIVVLDGAVISAYERFPLSVTGDGRSTIFQLLKKKQELFKRLDRDTVIKKDDPRILEELRRQGYTKRSVLVKGYRVMLMPNANLSTGGDAIDVTDHVHPKWKTYAKRLARDMNLRYIGIDVMTQEPLDVAPSNHVIIEVNAAPGLDNYATMGRKQQRIVEDLYGKVLLALLK
ncbi:cyanophycin synthetase [Patescibacteria group bacterium]|nr:cyanophycin synthetase [Patescibacteria group bacterium]